MITSRSSPALWGSRESVQASGGSGGGRTGGNCVGTELTSRIGSFHAGGTVCRRSHHAPATKTASAPASSHRGWNSGAELWESVMPGRFGGKNPKHQTRELLRP